MDENDWLAARFEEQQAHLRSVAYRMLGSLAEAEDAVQNSWLRLSSADDAVARIVGTGPWRAGEELTRALNLDANEAYALARRGSALLDYSSDLYFERSSRLCVPLWGSLMAPH